MRKNLAVVPGLLIMLALAGCGGKGAEEAKKTTPKAMTEEYLSYMKEGEYEKAAALTGTAFDAKEDGEEDSLQVNTIEAMYANMEYELQEEHTDGNTATVTVLIKNADYTDTMNNAVFETLKEEEDDAYTEEVFKKLLKEAPLQETEVTVNYRKKDGVWTFDGGNSQLRAAMTGYIHDKE